MNDPIATLARAISAASAAAQWDVVAMLARELEALRRGGAANVVELDAARRRRS